MINIVKILLGIDSDVSNEKILIYIDFISDYVKNYCNLDQICDELEKTVCVMAAEAFSQSENAKRLSIGDISVEFAQSSAFLEYQNILNKHRKVGF